MGRLFSKATVTAHKIIEKVLDEGAYAIDATMGNGNDTLFMARLVGHSGHVYAFDIQAQALENTTQLLKKHQIDNRVTLIHDGHEKMDKYITNKKIKAIVFNLGYLPRGDHSVITTPETTIKALRKSICLLDYLGVIVVVVYTAHEGGEKEQEAVSDFFATLEQGEYDVLKIENFNYINNPPFIFCAQKIS